MINVVDAVTLAPLLEQEPGAIERIRELRNEASVRKHMYNDHLISQAEHEGWLASLRNNPHTRIWAILFKGKIQGAVSLTAIDLKHKTADWAFYLSPETQGKGVGVHARGVHPHAGGDGSVLRDAAHEQAQPRAADGERHGHQHRQRKADDDDAVPG